MIFIRYSTAHLTMTSTSDLSIDWFIFIIVLDGYNEIAVSRNILIRTHIRFRIRIYNHIRIHIRSHILIHISIQFVFLFVFIFVFIMIFVFLLPFIFNLSS